MGSIGLEQRVAILEEKVTQLMQEKHLPAASSHPWLDVVFGAFKDDPEFEEAVKAGREWREAQNVPEDEEEPN